MSTQLQTRTRTNIQADMESIAARAQGTAQGLLNQGQSLLDRVFPPEQRSATWARLQSFASAHPWIAAFLLCQMTLSGIPLVLFITFTITVFVFSLLVGLVIGLVGSLLFTGFMVLCALFFVLPTLFLTTMAATFTFSWGFGGFYLLKWINSGAPVAQGKAVGEKLNEISGGKLGSLMDTARETARRNAPAAKQINGQKGGKEGHSKPRKVKREEGSSADEKSSNGFTILTEPAEGPMDDLDFNATKHTAPGGTRNKFDEALGSGRGTASDLNGH